MKPNSVRDWLILCDFDGTIAEVDVTDVLLQRFALPPWRAIETQWKEGRIGSRECLRRQVELLQLTRAELNAVLPTIALDPDFPEFVEWALAAGCQVRVVSEGFDQVIRALLARTKLPPLPIAATYLIPNGARAWTLGFPFAADDCKTGAATCKCREAIEARQRKRHVVLVGDGLSDCCVARHADLVFARGRLLEFCRAQGIRHHAAHSFQAVLNGLASYINAPPARIPAAAHGA
jgi:2,3-diketo-5-methylthio-1-phosphopentane phosphatase